MCLNIPEKACDLRNSAIKISELLDYPQTNIPALFFYAFRKNHKHIARDKTDRLLEDLGGLTAKEIGRLADLYNQPEPRVLLLRRKRKEKTAG